MSSGQDEAATQIETSGQKIDPRLIADEMAWRGKEIEVRLGSFDWERRIFHTVAKGCVWCFGDTETEKLFCWSQARPIEQKWRVPTDEDAKKRPKCRVRDGKDAEWKYGVLHFIKPGYSHKYVVECDANVFWHYCEILDE